MYYFVTPDFWNQSEFSMYRVSPPPLLSIVHSNLQSSSNSYVLKLVCGFPVSTVYRGRKE